MADLTPEDPGIVMTSMAKTPKDHNGLNPMSLNENCQNISQPGGRVMTDRWQARTLTEGQKRPLLHTAGNGWVSPVLLVDLNAFWPDGKPCDDLRWCAPAQDGAVWAAKWRDCEGPAVDLLPWSSDEAEAWLAGRDAVLVVADSLSSEATDSLISAKHERDQAHAWAVAALERCRVLQAQLDSERRHADELVQRINDVTEALGEHRTAGRPLAEDVRELVAERDEARAELEQVNRILGRGLDHAERLTLLRRAESVVALAQQRARTINDMLDDRDTLAARLEDSPTPGDVLNPADFGKGEAGVLRLAALLAEAPPHAVVENSQGEWQLPAEPDVLCRWHRVAYRQAALLVSMSDVRTPLDVARVTPLTVVAWPGGAL